MANGDLVFRKHASLTAPADGWELRAVAVDDNSEALCLWSRRQHFVVVGPAGDVRVELHLASPVRYPTIAGMPGGGLVLADSRVRVDPVTGSQLPVSAWAFDSGGSLEVEGSLGDGIEHLLSTPSGELWVAYFDEGVFGGGAIAGHGLARLDAQFNPVWLFPSGGEHGEIDDCYALNVQGETATAYFYAAFNIAQIRGDAVRSWGGPPPGAHGLLLHGDQCVLVGGYAERAGVVSHLRLHADGAELQSEARVDGLSASVRPLARICRGPEMHVIVGQEWYTASIS